MTVELLVLSLASLACVPILWLVPRAFAQDAVALFSFVVLWSVAPEGAIWLLVSASLTYGALQLARRLPSGGYVLGLTGCVLIAALLIGRELPTWTIVGMAYFTLRNLHLLFEGWMGRPDLPASLRETLHYQLFLPVLAVGPIHRFPAFRRSLRTRRLDAGELALGAERALFGLAMATVLGTVVMAEVERRLLRKFSGGSDFARDFAASALDWVQLYLVFAGLSGFAVGTALMMGLKIEENFDHPYRATSLLDFWTRWHMTLTHWCRDYVFQPVTAATRNPALGLLAAMVVVGLWHESSVYYVLWSFWQVLGIVANRVLIARFDRHGISMPRPVARILTPVLILGWLALARPVIERLLEALP